LERIPLTYYQDGQIGVQPQDQPSAGGESTTSQEAALKMIENLVENLKAKRE
jgi:enamine deaminase RidA (YjgF/YER057c/UK114 family)